MNWPWGCEPSNLTLIGEALHCIVKTQLCDWPGAEVSVGRETLHMQLSIIYIP